MTKPDFNLLPYEASTDLLALTEIWHQASLIAHAFLGKDRIEAQKHLIETVYLPAAETYVAHYQGQPIGFISLLDAVVGGLFVDPRFQGRGAGRLLINHAFQLKGQLDLNVYLDNPQARAFYKQMGFVEISQSPVDQEGLPFGIAHLRKLA